MKASSPSLAKAWIQVVKPEGIPKLLREQPRWLCWRAGPRKPTGKFDKVPVDPRTKRNINGRDPANWLMFAEAMNACLNGMADGIGFALSDQHPIVVDDVAFYVTVADFDHCAPRMAAIRTLWLGLGQPFIEVSPSNNGLHIWGLSRSPLKGGNAGEGKELYSGGRFVTMTGVGAKGTFGECHGLAALEQQWFPPIQLNKPSICARPPDNVVLMSAGDNWFERLSPPEKKTCLDEMLQVPAVIALADTLDIAPSPNWRTVVAACVRSGAPDAYDLCRAWAQTSDLFDPANFDVRWRSYARG